MDLSTHNSIKGSTWLPHNESSINLVDTDNNPNDNTVNIVLPYNSTNNARDGQGIRYGILIKINIITKKSNIKNKMAKLYCIGDELTITGLSLAGVKESHIANKANALRILEDVLKKTGEEDIIAVGHSVFDEIKEKIKKTDRIVVEIPDISGEGEDKTSALIKRAVGRNVGM